MQQILHPDYEWHNDRLKYTDQQVHEMPSWIKTKKETLNATFDFQCRNIDVDSFSEMQRLPYNMVKAHSQQTCPKDPLLLIILGVAGTGKSYLINGIRNLLQNFCAVTARTGKAAYNINGCTIYSLLKLPIGPRGYSDLTGQVLVRLQIKLKDIRYIIIDEYSMLGQTLFG